MPPDVAIPPAAAPSSRRLWAGAVLSVLALAGALLAAQLAAHVDDGDAQLYTVVARHMAADGTWLLPRYLPAIYPRFLEHLPFGFWPLAATVRWAGEAWLGPLCVLLSLGTVALTGWTAARVGGRWAGLAAMLVLASTESFFSTGGRPRLDVPLVLLATASVAPLLSGRWTWRTLLAAAGLAGLGALVKGPFGLLPLAAVVAAQVAVERSPRRALEGAVALGLAALPLVAFLLWDRAAGGPWWEGYVQNQLLASATGARTDGRGGWWLPLRTLVRRFWPGLLLLPLGAWRAVRPGAPAVRRVGLACLVLLVLLCLPARKLWHHALVLFPLLAVLAGLGVGPWLARWLAPPARERRAVWGLAGLAALGVGMAVAGAGRLLLRQPCIVHAELAAPLSALAPGTRLAVVAPEADWNLVSQLAVERALHPELAAAQEVAPEVHVALFQEGVAVPAGWRAVAHARGWGLYRRD